jgi:hypothetical protein
MRDEDVGAFNLHEDPDSPLRCVGQPSNKERGFNMDLYPLLGEQISRLEARLDETEKASHRIGRKDWLLLFFGVVLTLIVTDLITPPIVAHIFMMAVDWLHHLFRAVAKRVDLAYRN